MKFLFKMTLFVLVCISNFTFDLLAMNQEATNKVEKNIFEIIDSYDCDCTKLNTLNYEEQNIAKDLVFSKLNTPKSIQRIEIKNEKKAACRYYSLKLAKLNLAQNGIEKQKEILDSLGRNLITIEEGFNRKIECMNKILTTINGLNSVVNVKPYPEEFVKDVIKQTKKLNNPQ